MSKVMLLLGVAVGFVLGSRAGRRPYEQLEATVRRIAARPEVQSTVDQAKSAVQEKADVALRKVGDTVSANHEGSSTVLG
jgi:hypothetical protein